METVTEQSVEERDLVAALQAGNQKAYQQAVRKYSPGMLAVARYYLDYASAEDVVQDTWVNVVEAIRKFEGRSGLKTWLHRIVANRCKNRLRTANREISSEFGEELEPGIADRFQTGGRWATPPKLRFEEHAESLMENGALSDCLDKHLSALPEQQRSAVMLYEAHQHKAEDVCNILDISASNLRVLVHRARQKIYLMVETFQESGEC
ncbi:RNA polymerase sigma factor [uncultured Marinobacter sp.]|uniref:RNA polymerase sigma factor n=1 Tax=uncultured Marinobacter sp. TaxID=187379 RepID=UPI0030D7C978